MTSAISSLVRIWKISHSYPGCSFVRKIRVVYFSLKHSYLCNNTYLYTDICILFSFHSDEAVDDESLVFLREIVSPCILHGSLMLPPCILCLSAFSARWQKFLSFLGWFFSCYSSKEEAAILWILELDFNSDVILTFPGHEATWYHRYVLIWETDNLQ